MGMPMKEWSFEQVYAEHKELVWKLVSRYAAGRHDREDLFQEVFLKVHQALPKFRGEASLPTWLYRIAAKTALNFLQKKERYASFKRSLGLFRPEMEDANEVRFAEDLHRPLAKLNARQKSILIMSDIEERKLEEIAQLLGLPVGTVKSNLHRAREVLKKELKENNDGL